jgi:hypothetical protein
MIFSVKVFAWSLQFGKRATLQCQDYVIALTE